MKCLYCHSIVSDTTGNYCGNCGKKISKDETEFIIANYFRRGFKYTEIVEMLLVNHSIKMSLRTLKSKLKDYELLRRKAVSEDTFDQLTEFIQEKLEDTGSQFGYRSIWHASRLSGLAVPRDMVMNRLQEMDPEGVANRKSRKLKRRLYQSPGPNFCWHIDGYDKLKPYGFPIHGCIDGYSRKMIWLELVTSNNNPHIIANLYLKAAEQLDVVPKIVRSDHGTENVVVAAAQQFLVDENAHVFGSSHSNQRIEGWWSYFRKNHTSYIIDLFKSIVSEGSFDTDDAFQRAVIHYWFSDFIKKEIESTKEHWNSHYIRASQYNEVYGRPDYLYSVNTNNGFDIDVLKFNEIKTLVNENFPSEEDDLIKEYLEYLSTEMDLRKPKTFLEAKYNYLRTIEIIEEIS